MLNICLSMSKYPLRSHLGGTGVFHMLNICLSVSKYPLGSNLGGTGDWDGDWRFRVGIGFQGLPRAKRMPFYVKVSFRV